MSFTLLLFNLGSSFKNPAHNYYQKLLVFLKCTASNVNNGLFSLRIHDIICNYCRLRQSGSLQVGQQQDEPPTGESEKKWTEREILTFLNRDTASGSLSVNNSRGSMILALRKFCCCVQNLPLYSPFYIKLVHHTCQETKVNSQGHSGSLTLCLSSSEVTKE